MSSDERGRRRPKPRLLRRTDATDDAKPVTVPESPEALHADRAIVPFMIIEHQDEEGSSIGILMLEQAVA